MTRLPYRVLPAVALIVGFALAPTPAAAAPSGDLLLSADGVHFANSYSGELFHEIGAMVPGDSQSGRFWVRNATSEIAWLRVGIGSVGTSTERFLESLSMTASAGAEDSGILSLKESIVCTSLLDPVALAAGESVRVDLTVGLDVGAPSEVQSASTRISMVASLSNATPADFGDDVCRGDFEPVPASDSTASPTATPTPSPTPSPTIVSPPDFGSGGGILGNTAQWFQEYAIVVPFLAFAGGSSARFFVWRRRARRSPHPRGSTTS